MLREEVNHPSLEDVEVCVEHVGVDRHVRVLPQQGRPHLQALLNVRRRDSEHQAVVFDHTKIVQQACTRLCVC